MAGTSTTTHFLCEVCDCRMAIGSRAAHLSGKRHAANVRVSNAGTSTASSSSNVVRATQRSRRQDQLLHPNGRRRIRISEVQQVHGHTCEIPLSAYGEAIGNVRKSSLVTLEEVNSASDAWDARSILHDIDTQWGSLPHGGAYKDSDFYYGPGEYDF